jgi:alpha,alpha-trehalase
VRGRHVLQAGDTAYCALSWAEELEAPTSADEAQGKIDATRRFWRAWLGRARLPDHRFRDPVPALGARDQGPHVHADRSDRGRADHVPPGDAGRRAELGLPLQVDPRHDFHAAGAALPQPRLGGGRVHEFVADIEPTEDGSLEIMYGIDGRRDLTESTRDDLSGYAGAKPVRIGNGAFDQRQNDVFGAVLDSILRTDGSA